MVPIADMVKQVSEFTVSLAQYVIRERNADDSAAEHGKQRLADKFIRLSLFRNDLGESGQLGF